MLTDAILSCLCVQSEDMLYAQIIPAHHKHYVSVRSGSSSSFSPAELAKLLLTQKQFLFLPQMEQMSACLSAGDSPQFKESVWSQWSETFLTELPDHGRRAD